MALRERRPLACFGSQPVVMEAAAAAACCAPTIIVRTKRAHSLSLSIFSNFPLSFTRLQGVCGSARLGALLALQSRRRNLHGATIDQLQSAGRPRRESPNESLQNGRHASERATRFLGWHAKQSPRLRCLSPAGRPSARPPARSKCSRPEPIFSAASERRKWAPSSRRARRASPASRAKSATLAGAN